MKIIHISSLTNNRSSGVNNIVPSYIKWQSKYSKVFWYNISNEYNPPNDSINYYHDNKKNGKFNIELLEEPFCKPDLVVFHELFYYRYTTIVKQLVENKIPYIVIPHGSLTKYALKRKFIKKYIANKLFFGKLLRNAAAIQYLTKGEYLNSGEKWNPNKLIIPNGCYIPTSYKSLYRSRNLQGTFIGRKTINIKGLDLLMEACYIVKPYLKKYNCKINIYGPYEDKSEKILEEYILKYGLEEHIFLHEGIYDKNKENILIDSDFFILTSRSEGHPVALIEALSYGVPCLITEGTNMSEEVIEYEAGWSSATNSNGIANSIIKMLKNVDELNDYGKNARLLAQTYEWNSVAGEAILKYKNLCGK